MPGSTRAAQTLCVLRGRRASAGSVQCSVHRVSVGLLSSCALSQGFSVAFFLSFPPRFHCAGKIPFWRRVPLSFSLPNVTIASEIIRLRLSSAVHPEIKYKKAHSWY
eukprot:2756046-Rhodomonas_salina.4